MNKVLNRVKNVLLSINFLAIIIFIVINGIESFSFCFYIVTFLLLFRINRKDIKNKILLDIRYELLFILVEVIVLFIFARMFFDPNLNYIYYLNSDMNSMVTTYYFSQNIWYFFILYASIYLYHFIFTKEIEYMPSKYSKSSMICLAIHIITIPLILSTFSISFTFTFSTILFLLMEITLLIIEIISLIKNNYEKYDYPIYICFLFNLFALIAIFT